MNYIVGLFAVVLLSIGFLLPSSSKKVEHPLFKVLRPSVRVLSLFLFVYIIYYNITEKGFLKNHNSPPLEKLAGIWRVTGGSNGLGKSFYGILTKGELTIFHNNTFEINTDINCNLSGKWQMNEEYLLLNFNKEQLCQYDDYSLKTLKIKNADFTENEMVWFITNGDKTLKRNLIKIDSLHYPLESIVTPFTEEEDTKERKIRAELIEKNTYFMDSLKKESKFKLNHLSTMAINDKYYYFKVDSIYIEAGSTIEYTEQPNLDVIHAIYTPNNKPLKLNVKGKIGYYQF
ncbi:hypothetical protein [Runella limosa]|uniref:hypothetical protein n=1 Tax=Runella limosa TaxID=370978 RepID=UPI0003F6E98D|nr:hypothetical protein [Runella limosa]